MKSFHAFLIFVLSVQVASSKQGSVISIKTIKSSSKAIQAHTNDILHTKPPPLLSLSNHRGGDGTQSTSLHIRTISKKTAVVFGMILAFNSGILNGACLSGLLGDGTKQATSAVTGAWTNSALGAATHNKSQFQFQTKCILSYLFGSFLSGTLHPHPQSFCIDVPNYRRIFFLGSIFLCFAHRLCQKSNSSYFFVAAICNGMQNSITSTTTANLVRSAHFSGCTSDMGTFFGQYLRGNRTNLLKLKVFLLLTISFWIGGFMSYILTHSLGAQLFLWNAGLYFGIGVGLSLV